VKAQLGEACTSLGASLLWITGRKADAEALLREAVDLFDDLAARDPLGRLGAKHAAEARTFLARALLFSGRAADALVCARRSEQELAPLVQRFPEVKLFRRNLAEAQEETASASLALGALDDARRDAESALALMLELRDSDPEQDALGYASTQILLSHVLAAQREFEPARRLAASAVDWIEATGGELDAKLHANSVRTWRWDLLRCDAELGAGDRLVAGLRGQLRDAALPADWLEAARLLARGAVVVRHDEARSDGEQDEQAGALEDALLATLRTAREKGCDLAGLSADPALVELARRAELRAALTAAGLAVKDPGASN
jgi:hypothetical protein